MLYNWVDKLGIGVLLEFTKKLLIEFQTVQQIFKQFRSKETIS